MKVYIKSVLCVALSGCLMQANAMDPEEANKQLLFLAIAGTNDSSIPLGSSPGPRQVHAHEKMGKSISPEGSTDDVNSSQLHKKINLAQFHELFQNSIHVIGTALHQASSENSCIADILKDHIQAEKKLFNEQKKKSTQTGLTYKEEDELKVSLQETSFEIKATQLALYACQLLATKEDPK